ncbi:MOK (predicted) [Pycnogonum litorale]
MAFFEKYKIIGTKGEGTFGEVVKCQEVATGKCFACKIMKQTIHDREQVNRLREVQALRKLGFHPNILQLYEIIFDKRKGRLFLICELMDMNMYEMIRDRKRYMSECKVKYYMYQLLKALHYMHRNGIFHRDIKPENLLIRDNHLKLADFGSCRRIHSKQPYTDYISTRWYRSPECLLTDGYYTYKMDVWSAGCVFFELCSLNPLFPGINEVDQISRIHGTLGTPKPSVLKKLRKHKTQHMDYIFPMQHGTGVEFLIPVGFGRCIDLIYYMCTYDPDDRPNAKQVLTCPYFESLRETDRRRINNIEKSSRSERRTNRSDDENIYGSRQRNQDFVHKPATGGGDTSRLLPKDYQKKKKRREMEKRSTSLDIVQEQRYRLDYTPLPYIREKYVDDAKTKYRRNVTSVKPDKITLPELNNSKSTNKKDRVGGSRRRLRLPLLPRNLN